MDLCFVPKKLWFSELPTGTGIMSHLTALLFLVFSWPLLLRPHHIRALVILVTLLSLSLLFSTFSMRAGENRIWMTDSSRQNAAGREVMSAMDVHQPESSTFTLTTSLPPSTRRAGIGEVYQIVRKSQKPPIIKVLFDDWHSNFCYWKWLSLFFFVIQHILKNQMKSQGYILPAPSALLKTKHLFQNRTATPEDVK